MPRSVQPTALKNENGKRRFVKDRIMSDYRIWQKSNRLAMGARRKANNAAKTMYWSLSLLGRVDAAKAFDRYTDLCKEANRLEKEAGKARAEYDRWLRKQHARVRARNLEK
jgi:hypothetical protein